jgi:hypothetical protein
MNVILIPPADEELDDAIKYYNQHSRDWAINFIMNF